MDDTARAADVRPSIRVQPPAPPRDTAPAPGAAVDGGLTASSGLAPFA